MKNLLLFLLINIQILADNSPYSLNKFQNILNNSKLQAPTSKYDQKWCAKYGEFEQFENKYFYLLDNRYMTFKMCGSKNRSELREKDDWFVSTKKARTLSAKVKLFVLDSKREFTFLQIHSDSNREGIDKALINKPLLRIVWKKKYHKKSNHIWAIIRTSADPKEQNYTKIDLGEYLNNFFEVKITIQNSNLRLHVENKLKLDMSVSYWNNFWNYYKAGVYLQDEGCAKVLFEELILE